MSPRRLIYTQDDRLFYPYKYRDSKIDFHRDLGRLSPRKGATPRGFFALPTTSSLR